MPKHTPGPWGANSMIVYAVAREGREAESRAMVADCRDTWGIDIKEAVANARLIAAAPELLAAAQALLAEIYSHSNVMDTPQTLALLDAVDKAVGRE